MLSLLLVHNFTQYFIQQKQQHNLISLKRIPKTLDMNIFNLFFQSTNMLLHKTLKITTILFFSTAIFGRTQF